MKHPGGIQQANQGRMMAETDMAQANNSAQGVQGVKANLNAQRQNMNPQQLQESQVWEKNFDAYQQAQGGQGGGGMAQMAQGQQASKGMMGAQTPMGQQGGLRGQQGMMAGQLGMAQAGMAQAQGNNQKGMMQNEQSRAELTKQMGQAGAVRGSWKDAQAGGGTGGGGGIASMMGGGGSPFGQMGGQAGIAQQGGLMGQNAGAPGGGMAAAQQALMGQGQLTPEQQEAQRKKAQALGVV
jgi:hypothetical protein